MSVRPVGAIQKNRDFGIEQLEKKLTIAIAERSRPLHYDELCRIDEVSKVRAIRTEDGTIDILRTFMQVRNNLSTGGIRG